MTVQDWAALDDDLPGELVGGALVDGEDVTFLHAWLVTELAARFLDWTGQARALGVAGTEARRVGLAPWLAQARPLSRLSRVPPDVAVEVLTAEPRDVRRDRIAKHDEYAAFGIRFYWIVDPEVRTLEVFELRDGAYSRVLGASDGSALPVPGIAGATLDLDATWRRIDELLAESAEPTRGPEPGHAGPTLAPPARMPA